MHRFANLTVAAACMLSFGSCTCHKNTEPPPSKVADRRAGFGSVVTPRKPPEVTEEEKTPAAVTPVAPIPTGLPDQSAVPENFPAGVPIPKGSKVVAVQNLAGNGRSVVFSSDKDGAELFDLYRDSMSREGWGKPSQEYQGHDQSFLSFKKGDTITNISVSRDPKTGKRVVAVMYYEEKPLPFSEF